MLKISEVSQKTKLSIATIRYYTDLDMVPSVQRNYKDQRVFDEEAVVWLEGIKFLRELGTPIPEIKEYMELCQKTGAAALKKRHQILLQQRERAELALNDSQLRLDKLDQRIELENQIINGKKRDSLSAARRFCQ